MACKSKRSALARLAPRLEDTLPLVSSMVYLGVFNRYLLMRNGQILRYGATCIHHNVTLVQRKISLYAGKVYIYCLGHVGITTPILYQWQYQIIFLGGAQHGQNIGEGAKTSKFS